ncbi:hypothetical protein RH831_10995 [Halodesulfurarchaeum sp. HSR-GB]|uniref:hypothetical protein n=1 Tax=Halodesulfurarchaeum sp. HSR-GB TaxID=3074077 RepID=UPI0028568D2E|nr:hypothetical protein [Halodesulfurarchaeum sp. HSR-GB]MDR5657702.1 hypothetical protein [Halodesulfurarchaeum sp. HSR-GB]
MSGKIPDDIPDDIDKEEYLDFVMEKVEEDPLLRDLMNAVHKRFWIEHELFDDDLSVALDLVQVIMLTSYVSKVELDHYLSTKEGRQVLDQVKVDFERGAVSNDLEKRYQRNATPVLDEIDEYIEETRRDLFGDSYEEIVEIEESDRDDKNEILERLRDPILEDPENKELVDRLSILRNTRSRVESFPYDKSDLQSEIATIDGDEYRIHKHYALQILKPRLYTQLYRFEEEYEGFPLRWLTDLTIPQARAVYQKYKQGDFDESFVVDEVEREGYFDDLLEEVAKLPSFREREDLMQEVVDNYRDERYASVINLILPQTEFLLWIYGAYLNQQAGETIYLNTDYDNFWQFNPRDHNDLSLQSVNGNEIQKPRIRDLVQNTAVQDYLNEAISEYFVDELYEERNPILHGNVADYHSDLEAAKKLIFFKTIIERVTDQLRDDIVDQIYDDLPDDFLPDDQ